MRVAHITPAFHPANHYGGPPESAYRLSLALAEHGHEVRVLTTDANGPRPLELETDVERPLAPRLTARYCKRYLREATAPRLFVDLGGYVRWADVVHLNAVYNSTSLPTLLAARAMDRPVVWSTRGALQGGTHRTTQHVKRAWEALARLAMPRRVALHVTSAQEGEESAPYFPGAHVEVIPNGVAIPDHPKRHARGEHLVIGALGRLHPIKGLDRLLQALALRIQRGAKPITLRVAGGGDAAYQSELEELALGLGLRDRVEFLGAVTGEAKREFFESLDVLVAPSHRENFGIAIAEALAHGIPVVASRGTPWEVLVTSNAGLWVENEPSALAAAIDAIERTELDQLGRNARDLVQREFGWPRIARSMTTLYERMLAQA